MSNYRPCSSRVRVERRFEFASRKRNRKLSFSAVRFEFDFTKQFAAVGFLSFSVGFKNLLGDFQSDERRQRKSVWSSSAENDRFERRFSKFAASTNANRKEKHSSNVEKCFSPKVKLNRTADRRSSFDDRLQSKPRRKVNISSVRTYNFFLLPWISFSKTRTSRSSHRKSSTFSHVGQLHNHRLARGSWTKEISRFLVLV